jgi:hypothetical protein
MGGHDKKRGADDSKSGADKKSKTGSKEPAVEVVIEPPKGALVLPASATTGNGNWRSAYPPYGDLFYYEWELYDRDTLPDGERVWFRVIGNYKDKDGKTSPPQELVWLIGAKNIFARQLPKMDRSYITRLVSWPVHDELLKRAHNGAGRCGMAVVVNLVSCCGVRYLSFALSAVHHPSCWTLPLLRPLSPGCSCLPST